MLVMKFVLATLAFSIVSLAQVTFADRYKLAMSQDDVVCKPMVQFFDDHLKISGKTLYAKNSEFSPVEWKPVENLGPDLGDLKGEIMQSQVDIDNDGQIDLVVKIKGRLRGVDTDQLAIFTGKRRAETQLQEFTQEVLGKANYLLDFSGERYELKKIPKAKEGTFEFYHSVAGVFELMPFRFQNTTYISMMNPYFGVGDEDNKWRVITKYIGPSKLDDVCYLERVKGAPRKADKKQSKDLGR